jgi:hypothetical protein
VISRSVPVRSILPPVLAIALLVILGVVWFRYLSTAPVGRNRIRFCEAFQKGDEPLREDSTFSIGAISMAVDLSSDVKENRVLILIYRMTRGSLVPYGHQASVNITPSYTSFRLDDALSFADTGTYVVRLASLHGHTLAEGRLRIIGSAH